MPDAKRILIIDDERLLHAMLKSVLGAHGYETISAMTGEDGLAMARSEHPDMILLDVIMPKMKGREVCRSLKADPVTRSIPVVFLTAKDSPDDQEAELAAGALAHLNKPIHAATLLRCVKRVLGQ
jgi:CheY-like chemotaxis protein